MRGTPTRPCRGSHVCTTQMMQYSPKDIQSNEAYDTKREEEREREAYVQSVFVVSVAAGKGMGKSQSR